MGFKVGDVLRFTEDNEKHWQGTVVKVFRLRDTSVSFKIIWDENPNCVGQAYSLPLNDRCYSLTKPKILQLLYGDLIKWYYFPIG